MRPSRGRGDQAGTADDQQQKKYHVVVLQVKKEETCKDNYLYMNRGSDIGLRSSAPSTGGVGAPVDASSVLRM